VIILGIESSCDESAAAVVEAPCRVLSSAVSSQIALHGPYGGVVPEIACREHVRALPAVIADAIAQAGVGWESIDAVAVTYGPGLASSLLVGLASAKALSLRLDVPLVAVNHLQGHLFSPFLSPDMPDPAAVCPFVSLIVSGGHTCLVRVDAPGRCELLGQTIDDAAGEAFDKGANLLGLGYPGGPVMDRLAREGDPCYVRFPRGRVDTKSWTGGLDPRFCFSFSGLKTALRYYLEANPVAPDEGQRLRDVAASYQEAIVEALLRRVMEALEACGSGTLAVGGGVSLNSRLRGMLASTLAREGRQLLLTAPAYCGDNAAMIAAVAGLGLGGRGESVAARDVCPNLSVLEAY
jgi:N6-L-threonylcarbamoyladenine synthase